MDTSEAPMPDWRTWCRLCAKDDIHSNIDVFQVNEHKSNLTANVEHLFGVCMRQTDELPHMLCTECYSLLTKLATFTERVAKAQDMYHTLLEHDDSNDESVDMHEMRTKYGLLDGEREHLMLMQPITAVDCYDSKTKLATAANQAMAENVIKNMEKCLLDVANEQLQSKTVLGDAEEHEVPEDPFHTVDFDCIEDIRSGLEDDNGEDDRSQSGNRKSHRRSKPNPNYVESETNESDSHSLTNPLKRLAKDSTVVDAETLEEYPCSKCPGKFTCIEYYRKHMKRMHSQPNVHCDQCGRVFKTQYLLDRHVKIHKIICPYCEKKFYNNSNMRAHMKRVHMIEQSFLDEECGIAVSDSEMKPLKRPANDTIVNEYSCTECQRKFAHIDYYRKHMKHIHSMRLPLPELHCDQCDRVFTTQFKLDRHKITHQLTCPYCEKKFQTNMGVQGHIKSVHMDERPFVCEECGITVHTNASLKSHMLVHTDDKPFVCDVCNWAFKDKRKLKTHKQIHDPKKYICSECGLELNSRSTLRTHRVVHSDVMKHKCDYCGRAFKRAGALKTHLLLHAGIKPYACEFCDRTFANSSNCRSHKKKVHPEEFTAQEAAGSGNTYTCTIPKLEVLKALTKTAENLMPVVPKKGGRFASSKKLKSTRNDKDKVINCEKSTTEAQETGNPSSTTPNTTSIPAIDNHNLKGDTNNDVAA